jgi:DNA-binding LytR/AlgR family response regulator
MKLNCLLIDDEPEALEVLESYIALVEHLELVGKCENAMQAFQVLHQKKVDLIFLDIKMPKLLGTDFLRSLQNPPKVIFTTAYREYALDGFELNVVDYLLKPIPFDRFLKAVAKVTKTEEEAPTVSTNETSTPDKKPFLYFRHDRKMVKVMTGEILYIESLKDYVKIVVQQGKPLVIKQTITSLEEMLPGTDFIRIHRSYIVAIDKIQSYTPTLIEIAGAELPVGRLFQKEVERALKMQK